MIAAGGTSYTISVRADTRALQHLSCSVKWGCEVTVDQFFRAESVTLTDTRIGYKVVASASGLRIILLPSAALVDDGGVVAPLEGMLRIVLADREYDVQVAARDINQSYNLEFSSDVSIPLPQSTPPNQLAGSSALDVASLNVEDMDFGWKVTGSSRRCESVFSYHGALWCKLPEGVDMPAAFAIEGKLQRPLNVVPIGRDYLKILAQPARVRLVWGQAPGQDVFITREHE
ncbi:MAG TPA: hypothetical protein VNF68_12560 [Candidatus Baltobacteraceae bacterium]|nr:hypothetical protein [Candidatus Baltobacteraceae bacterium]